MVRRRLSLPFTDVIEDDEVIADEEINNWKWKSYHEIDVKQNMGYGRYIHKISLLVSGFIPKLPSGSQVLQRTAKSFGRDYD